ncbi:MAG: sigma-70 family RNA polymerase sigma factor [Acidobacteriota bacterium]|nr:MAG: sigma-70 family RNA polymerase sigma factor [Acidobacteriota bacterium]
MTGLDASSPLQITQLLVDWRNGDRESLDRLIPLVYEELRRIARRSRRKNSSGDTLQTTDLINEAYLKLLGKEEIEWRDRVHFFAVAARVMRFILIDNVRAKRYAKRGGGVGHISIDDVAVAAPEKSEDILALDAALETLAGIDKRKSLIVEMRYFGGMNIEEVAEVLGVSEITVKREWARARAWLYRELKKGAG